MPQNPYTVRGNRTFTLVGFNHNGPRSDDEVMTDHAPRYARAWGESVTVLRNGKPIGSVSMSGNTRSSTIFAT